MRKTILLLCSLAFGLSGCASATHDPTLRAREERAYPSATLGTDNPESQWYRTQTIAPPSAPGSAAPAAVMPARPLRTPVPARSLKTKPVSATPGPTGNPAL